jgi:conjugative relaxase-like TrwC/TraI family protein
MLVVHKIGLGQAGYYLDGRSTGVWTGAGCDDLGLAGPVDQTTFEAALSGCDAGGRLLLSRRSPRRRAGFDLIFGAPKSVSLLAALMWNGLSSVTRNFLLRAVWARGIQGGA